VEDETALTGERLTREMDRYPPQVSDEYQKAWKAMASVLSDKELVVWAQGGLEMAQQTVRSWEAAGRYFKVSPKVVGLMPFSYFIKWAECGSALCRESPTLALCYFESSPGVMARLRSRHIESWSDLGRSLYKGTWKSSILSCKFFEVSPALLASLTMPELGRFVVFLESLSNRSYDLSMECLDLGQKVFPLLGESRDAFLSLVSSLAEANWRQVKGIFEATARSLPRIRADQRLRFLKLAGRLRESGCANVPIAMLEVSQSLEQLDEENQGQVLKLAEALLEVLPPAMPEFIKGCPQALERVTLSQLEKWFEEGVRLLKHNSDGGLAYFRVESAHSQEVLEGLSSSVEFTRIKDLMEMYCRALAGAEVSLSASEDLAEKNIGWVSGEAPSTEGSTVFVPSLVDRYATKQENFDWFKVVSTHQVAHLEFGSFRFEFERPSTLFRDMRPVLGAKGMSGGGDGASAERGWVTDLQRFFDIFEDRRLALDVFTVVEDGRLDVRVKAEYPGINQAYGKVQQDSLQGRPEVESLPAREALLELLVRLSLQRYEGLSAPRQYVQEARKAARIARRAVRFGATVEDTAEATLRIYAIIAQIPNAKIPPEEWQSFDEDQEDEDVDYEELLRQLMAGMGPDDGAEGEQEYSPSQDVDYRGDFKPELVQLLTQLRMQKEGQKGEASTEPITQEMLEELLKNSTELDILGAEGDAQKSTGSFVDNVLKEVGLNAPKTPEQGQGPLVHVDEEGGSLDSSEPQTFVYDEWDFRADGYKPRWCIVRQKIMAEGDPGYYGSTLHSYGPLVDQIRRQFELMVPEVFRKVRKLEDGAEIDIDDVIEAFVDIRTGVGPSEKLYWRRNKIQRDVAVVFLLDTSASTAEAIDESRKVVDDWEAPGDPLEYMAWLKNRRGEGNRRTYKRIIDLEKEAVVLLIHALEAIGDMYGIYSFSGYGRENVEFYIVKDVNEEFSEKVKCRIDRIAPLHATRMGPAIRHATSKLETQEARTKLLFLISDGRPQDRGYSREGVEKEYAVHDTRMALDEAQSKDITAFCLTVDKNGHDYLKTMCQDIGYEVLDDIHALPQRLLYLYRRLTM
jgi:hypothetical protein